jgi:hypothetical protein
MFPTACAGCVKNPGPFQIAISRGVNIHLNMEDMRFSESGKSAVGACKSVVIMGDTAGHKLLMLQRFPSLFLDRPGCAFKLCCSQSTDVNGTSEDHR